MLEVLVVLVAGLGATLAWVEEWVEAWGEWGCRVEWVVAWAWVEWECKVAWAEEWVVGNLDSQVGVASNVFDQKGYCFIRGSI